MDLPLTEQLSKLQDILSSIRSAAFWESLPIIDETREGNVVDIHENDLPGLRHLRMSIQKEIETIESHLALQAKSVDIKPLSTNSLYYLALWNEMLHAPKPVTALGKMFTCPTLGERPECKVKVDIVADNGRRWIRVNTTKSSRLQAEFRHIEAFSYGSSEEDSDDERPQEAVDGHLGRMLPMDEYLENTVYETGRLLLHAAQHYAKESGYCPEVQMRLNRLEQNSSEHELDKRIIYSLDKLREMGVLLSLGPSCEISLPPAPRVPSFYTPKRFNLDLSLLVALVTDITHAPLPKTAEEADARFHPQTERSWKRRHEKHPHISEDAVEHCRALADQTRDEMEHGLIQRIYSRIRNEISYGEITFWTTSEARDRFKSIVEKIGGSEEQRRASALFSEAQDATSEFWRDSRIAADQRPKLLPIRILPPQLPPMPAIGRATSFHQQLAVTCRSVLERPPRPDVTNDDSQRKMPAPTRFAARLSAHTVQSLLWGAEEGMVTLTSNKTSVRLILREMRGFALPSANDEAGPDEVPFALWVMEPRSLSQDMRNDIEDPPKS